MRRAIRWQTIFAASVLGCAATTFTRAEPPTLTDSRLELTLFSEDPDVVTPIGMVIDQRDRIFVIESHTHHPPDGYLGPDSDRIKILVDNDDDGKPDRISVFAEGIHQAMNLALSPSGELYVVCAREVLRLTDDDEDGVCDRKDQVLKLVTRERYAHNSLLGITFDRGGWMYVSRGNVGSHYYRFQGSDGSNVEGYGDGGNVVRCRPDGSRIQEFATGFWNPFDLKFDRCGRLLLVDNDPDARGPNRLVHVVRAGDFGYKSLYGGGGNHPFQGWDGTLPGTLPYIAGTGEAPCAVLDCRRAALPNGYQTSVLATIWNENSIERFDLRAKGGSLVLHKKSRFMTGPQDFRPVAMDCDSRGNLFVTDWVLVDYPNHGRGRIWRVRTNADVARSTPQRYFAPYLRDSTASVRVALAKSADGDAIARALGDNDPFVRHAAVIRLTEPALASVLDELAGHTNPRVRLGVLLASREPGTDADKMIDRCLRDPDQTVRAAALMCAGERLDPKWRAHLDVALSAGPVDAPLFETYLAAVRNLDEGFIEAYRARKAPKAKSIQRALDPTVLVRAAQSRHFSHNVRALAIRQFDDETSTKHRPWLLKQIREDDGVLALAAIRRFAHAEQQDAVLTETLATVALDWARSSRVRCEALLGLQGCRVKRPDRFLALLECADSDVAVEAARTIRTWWEAGLALECTKKVSAMKLTAEVKEPMLFGRFANLLDRSGLPERPQTNEQWRSALMKGGDAGRGRRVFFTKRVTCAKCHTVDGRGGILGPDLSQVAQSKSRKQIITAVLEPSAEFPPQYQAWIVVTTDGEIHRGLQLDHKSGGAIVLTTEDGNNRYFKAAQIEAYKASPKSLMPDRLAETMSVNEFKDLIAFLQSLK